MSRRRHPALYDWIALGAIAIVSLSAYLGGGSSTEGEGVRLFTIGLSGLCLIGLAVLVPRRRFGRAAKTVVVVILLLSLVFFVQLVPLPDGLWSALPGRDFIALEAERLGTNPSSTWRSVSLSPLSTLLTYLELMPAFLAAFAAGTISYRKLNMPLLIFVSLAFFSGLWGFAQILVPSFGLYLWDGNIVGMPTGAFANINHQADLMIITLPMIAAILVHASPDGRDLSKLAKTGAGVIGITAIACLAAAGSIAGYILLPFALGGAVLLFLSGQERRSRRSRNSRYRIWYTLLAVVGVIAIIGTVISSPQLTTLGGTDVGTGSTSRFGILNVSLQILSDHWLLGSGAGTFSDVYRMYEDASQVTAKFINHAHNDYLELLVEFGIVGVLGLALFGFVLIRRMFHQGWTALSPVHRALLLCILLILLHSLVDFVLRSQLILITFATLTALYLRVPPEDQPA